MSMLNREALKALTATDLWLDGEVAPAYKDQPLAQDWARVTKVDEEHGEALAELILATGQNPRKPHDPAAGERLLKELADRAITSILAIQHFTKDAQETDGYFGAALVKAYGRAIDAGYGGEDG